MSQIFGFFLGITDTLYGRKLETKNEKQSTKQRRPKLPEGVLPSLFSFCLRVVDADKNHICYSQDPFVSA